MINLGYVATFLTLATTGSFREAARRSGLSQPAVSQHIKRLEQSLKVELIDRNHTRSTLTPEGKTFLPYAETLVRTSERARALFDQQSIVVGASSNVGIYLLPKYLKAYRDRSPLDLDVVIADNSAIADKLQCLAIDVAVMEWWDGRPGFAATKWKHEPLVVIVPPGHAWSTRSSIDRDMLTNISLLGGESGTGTGRLLERYFGEQAKSIKVDLQLGSTEAVKQAVHAGLGISIVMASAVTEEQQNGSLRAIPLQGESLYKDVYIVQRDGGFSNEPARQFARFLLEYQS